MKRPLVKTKQHLLENEFVFLFISLFALIFLPSLIYSEEDTPIFNNILIFFVIMSSIYAVFNTKKHLYIGLILGLIAVFMNSLALYFRYNYIDHNWGNAIRLTQLLSFSIFFFYITIQVLKKVMRSKSVTLNVLFGSIAGYFLLGINGAFASMWYYINNPNSYLGLSETKDALSDFIYFSFVTLSTLGYGDITPETQQTKSLAVFISVVGQFYMTILVAFLVSKYSKE